MFCSLRNHLESISQGAVKTCMHEPIGDYSVFSQVKTIILIFTFVLLGRMTPRDSAAQSDSLRAIGVQVVLTNSGFGLGAYRTRQLTVDYALSMEVTLGAVKDEREVAFFDRFGRRDVPDKANYLLEIPLQIGVEKRVFRTKIEDNFRPFIHASAGGIIGWSYPYFDDKNRNGTRDEGERTFDVISGIPNGHVEPGIGGGIFIGAHFGDPVSSSQGVRLGYRISYYRDPIALLERGIKDPSRRIATPVIIVHFGRIRR